jgi:MFS family permease
MSRIETLIGRLRGLNPQLRLFLAGVVFMGVAVGAFETTFNNYVSDTFSLGADARGRLEFPRELPGFLTALFAGILFFLPETLIGAFAAFAVGLGMLGLILWGDAWHPMLALITLWSVGAHLLMPVRSSIAMELAHSAQKGRRLGQIQGAGIAAMLVGCGVVWLIMRVLRGTYEQIFLVGGIAALASGGMFWAMRMPRAHLQRPKFVWHRRYWLYYVLSLLFGARKQIFLTFGPWVLIQIFQQKAYVFAQLGIAATVLGMVFQPALGRAIDRFGERVILSAEALCTVGVCVGYGFADRLDLRPLALGLLFACYVADQLLFGVGMARDTYLSKIVLRPDHVAPTLSMGVSINHAVSMSIPALGGWLWLRAGHKSVFLVAAGIAVVTFAFALLVRVPALAPAQPLALDPEAEK